MVFCLKFLCVREESKTSGEPMQRTPLIIIEMHMPNEIETLAPKHKRRDIHRPPLFCRNYQRSQSTTDLCNCKVNTTLDFIVRGKEIDDRNGKKLDDSSADNDNDCENAGNIDDIANCIDCCACFLEMERRAQQMSAANTDEPKICVNVENYLMDSHGNLPKNADMLHVSDEEDEANVDLLRANVSTQHQQRLPSPNTSRVIRITLNNKNSMDGRKQR